MSEAENPSEIMKIKEGASKLLLDLSVGATLPIPRDMFLPGREVDEAIRQAGEVVINPIAQQREEHIEMMQKIIKRLLALKEEFEKNKEV